MFPLWGYNLPQLENIQQDFAVNCLALVLNLKHRRNHTITNNRYFWLLTGLLFRVTSGEAGPKK